MNIEDWEARDELADGASLVEEYRRSDAEELLFINWRLIVQIEREHREQQELAREFEEELDELFALIHSPEPSESGSPYPPGWPDL